MQVCTFILLQLCTFVYLHASLDFHFRYNFVPLFICMQVCTFILLQLCTSLFPYKFASKLQLCNWFVAYPLPHPMTCGTEIDSNVREEGCLAPEMDPPPKDLRKDSVAVPLCSFISEYSKSLAS